MKPGEVIRGYRVISAPTNSGGGRCMWAFAEKKGRAYFIKQFLDPKWPTESSMGSPVSKMHRRAECERFEARHREVNTRINPTAVGGGNLVTAIEFFLEGSSFYKVTDRVAALPVADLRRFTRRQAAVVLRTLCQSIKLLHRAGIVHGDLKPANVLLQRSATSDLSTAKVIDFDDSYPSGDPPPPDQVVGDQMFGAPEWLRYVKQDSDVAAGQLTTAADIFALGLVFHVYLCGDLPDYERTLFAAPADAVCARQELLLFAGLDGRMSALIARMLAVDPVARPSIEEVISGLADEEVVHVDESLLPPEVAARPVPASRSDPTRTDSPRSSRLLINLGPPSAPPNVPRAPGPRIRRNFES
jgi:eukaryotic-like serine/threonine-protein kinase